MNKIIEEALLRFKQTTPTVYREDPFESDHAWIPCNEEINYVAKDILEEVYQQGVKDGIDKQHKLDVKRYLNRGL